MPNSDDDRDIFEKVLINPEHDIEDYIEALGGAAIPAGVIIGALVSRGMSRRAAKQYVDMLRRRRVVEGVYSPKHKITKNVADDYIRGAGRRGAATGALYGGLAGGGTWLASRGVSNEMRRGRRKK